MNNFVVQYAHWIVRWRWAVIVVTLFAGILGTLGMQYVAFSGDYRQFFSAENPELAAHDLL